MAIHAGWILPLVLWAATASLLRAGRTILDRLVLSLGALVGTTCAAGLVLSLWPVTLRPVPVFGIGFTILVVLSVLTRRRPQFPVRTAGLAEAGVVLTTLVSAAFAVYPFLGKGFAGRLGILAMGGDLARHFTIYDGLRVTGGFLFMHRTEALKYVDDGYESYPQGVHFIYALLANVLPQGADRDDTVASFDLLISLDIATLVFLCLAMLWGARWVAGPLMRNPLTLALLAVICGYALFGEPVTMLTQGFPSEMAGGGLLALLVAIVVRPVRRLPDQALLVSSLLVGISFTYFLFMPFAGLLALLWVWRSRRALRGHWVKIGLLALVTGALVMVSPVVNTLMSPASVGNRLLLPGTITKVDRSVVVFWLLMVMAGGLLAWRRKIVLWRNALIVAVLSLAPAVPLFAYQVYKGRSQETYYLDKLLHQSLLTAVVVSGVLLLMAPKIKLTGGLRNKALPVVVTAMVALAMFVRVANVEWNGPVGLGRSFLSGRDALPSAGASTETAITMFPKADGRVTWVQLSSRIDQSNREASHWATLYTSVLQRNYRDSWSTFYWGYPWLPNTEEETAEFLMTSPVPLRILVGDQISYEFLNRIQARYPSLDLEIVDLRKKKL
ncbi:hypothetical protein [Longispora albida]|uniref:hypothetical protein n=1 Tax=Longispora albida TaxID=203523 RepID=UPI0003658D6C|nr:hypothetical protein [Longispora albida]